MALTVNIFRAGAGGTLGLHTPAGKRTPHPLPLLDVCGRETRFPSAPKRYLIYREMSKPTRAAISSSDRIRERFPTEGTELQNCDIIARHTAADTVSRPTQLNSPSCSKSMTSHHPSDTISVRADERFDERAVEAFLRGKLPGTENPLSVRQFGGGAANLTYLLDYGSHEYVLRRPPLGPVAPSAHDMARESKVLLRLWKAFPLAPRAYLFSDDETIVGAPFFIMERRQGTVVRLAIPPAYDAWSDAPARMSIALVEALSDLHAVDYEAIGLGDLGRPAGFIRRQIEGWWRRWQAAQGWRNCRRWTLSTTGCVENEPPEAAPVARPQRLQTGQRDACPRRPGPHRRRL